jgi:hypothetical protein
MEKDSDAFRAKPSLRERKREREKERERELRSYLALSPVASGIQHLLESTE